MHMTMQERKKLLQRMEHTETNGNKLVWKHLSSSRKVKQTIIMNLSPQPKKEQCKQYKEKLTKELGRSN
jgi:hypothetical protein